MTGITQSLLARFQCSVTTLQEKNHMSFSSSQTKVFVVYFYRVIQARLAPFWSCFRLGPRVTYFAIFLFQSQSISRYPLCSYSLTTNNTKGKKESWHCKQKALLLVCAHFTLWWLEARYETVNKPTRLIMLECNFNCERGMQQTR